MAEIVAEEMSTNNSPKRMLGMLSIGGWQWEVCVCVCGWVGRVG